MDPPDIEREVRTFILPAPANAGYGRKHRDPSKLPGERQRREAPDPWLSAIPREVQAFTLAERLAHVLQPGRLSGLGSGSRSPARTE
jgi:hypothetical protein